MREKKKKEKEKERREKEELFGFCSSLKPEFISFADF